MIQDTLHDVIQVYAINESSICIRKNNQIIIWGSNENGILGKEKINNDTNNKKLISGFIRKSDFSEIFKTTMIKENLDYTEAFINSRKLFNTKFNQIKRDNMIKKIQINELEERKKAYKEDANKNFSKNVKLNFILD